MSVTTQPQSPVQPTMPGPPSVGGSALALLQAMRVPHWIKNAFVVAPLLFAQKFLDPSSCLAAMAALLSFCMLSSAVYLINDIRDRHRDAAHPIKCRRPIASGRLGAPTAMAAAVALIALGLGLSLLPGLCRSGHASWDIGVMLAGLPPWAAGYLVLNVAYTFWLKDRYVVDVLTVAMGFVLRAMAGAAAISVLVSPWLVVCTFSLCLFIALTKRRSEIVELAPQQAQATRKVNVSYDPRDVEHMITVSSAMATLTYSLYCLSPRHSPHMVWTIPLVIYGLFRYNRLTRQAGKNDPVSVLLKDKAMWLVVLAYVCASAVIISCGRGAGLGTIFELAD